MVGLAATSEPHEGVEIDKDVARDLSVAVHPKGRLCGCFDLAAHSGVAKVDETTVEDRDGNPLMVGA